MSFLTLSLIVALAVSTLLVLADSILRLWFAVSGMKAQMAVSQPSCAIVTVNTRRPAQASARTGYARAGIKGVPLRVAA